MFSSLGSSGVSQSNSSCNSDMDLDRYSGDEDEEDAFISFTTLESKCERLYEQGLEFKYQGDLQESLSYFLKCLEGMQECQYFAKLPQTLHQLSDLYRSLQHLERADAYSKAEKLFYEAITTEPRAVAAKERRRPFKKSKSVSSSVAYNPAEYANLLSKKVEVFEKQASVCAEEGKLDLSEEYSKKASRIRNLLGQSYPVIGGMTPSSTIHTCSPLEGDLSEQVVGTLHTNGISQSAPCGGAHASLYATSENNGSPCTKLLTHGEHYLQTESPTPVPSDTRSSDQVFVPGLPQAAGGIVLTSTLQGSCGHGVQIVGGECGDSNIHRHPRQEEVSEASKEEKVMNYPDLSKSCAPGKVQGKVGSRLHLPEVNLCAGVTNKMSRLSELKNPMCVNLDLHNSPGEGVEPTRCLPLWILLLPALLALAGYVLYYH